MNHEKSAQISIFVILAGILLIVGLFAFVSTSDTAIFSSDKPTFKIKEFTEKCLEDQSRYALREIGKKGGWYYSPNPDIYAKQGQFNTLIERAVGFEHPFYSKLDYWRYFDETSNTFTHNIPLLQDESNRYSISNQMISLIESTINSQCLEDYASFKDRYAVGTEKQKLDVRLSSLEDNSIIVELYLPVTITNQEDGTIDSIDVFEVEIENLIRDPYYMAQDIILAQQNRSFIETSYLDFIYQYQKTGDKDFLPPFYDFRFGVADYSISYADEEKELLQRIFNTHSGEIIILDTALTNSQVRKVNAVQDVSFRAAKSHQNYYLSQLEDSYLNTKDLRREYQDYTTKLVYDPFFPLAFSFSNGNAGGQVLTNKVFNQNLLVVQIQHTTYQTGYDVTVPTLYQISSSDVNPKNKFLFNVPIEVNIQNNNPLQVLLNNDIGDFEQQDEKFAVSYCDPAHYISQEVSLKVSEFNTFDEKIPLDDVSFTFACSTQPSTVCNIDPLHSEERYNSQEYRFSLPINCPNSELRISKKGYIDETFEVSPSLSQEIREDVALIQPKTLDLFYSVAGKDVGRHQESVILFEPINHPEYIQAFRVNSETDVSKLNVTLVPDTYSITSITYDNTSRTIPGKPGTKCSFFEKLLGCQDTPPLPPLKLNGWILSNFDIKGYEVTYNDLKFAKRMYAQIPGVEYPTSYDEMEQNLLPESDPRYIRID